MFPFFRHPYVTLFHVLFRMAAIISYLLCGWFSDSFIFSFVFVVLMLSADFWTVKNITGRLLVGLRWWNYVDDKGVSNWIFETKGQSSSNFNYAEKQIFWIALIACPIVWTGFFVIALFGLKFKWMVSIFLNLISILFFVYIGIPRCTSHSLYAISLYQGLCRNEVK